ncbi:MAG: cell division protein SepF [Candidatus Bathyarchaeia archaeon]
MVNLDSLKKILGIIRVGGKKKIKEREKEELQQLSPRKMYLKALTLHSLEEIDDIKNEIKCGNILIVRIEPLVRKSVEDAKRAVNELSEFAASIGGDIARLGEERIILTPPSVQIWKEKFSETASK